MAISRDPFNLIICGVGGQGNILISGLIGNSLIKKGYHVAIGETFGAAQRGGAVFSSVRVSSKGTYGPLIPEGNVHLILSLEPLETLRILQKYGNPAVVCVTNISPVPPVGVLAQKDEYPDYSELKEAIKKLSRATFFVDATAIALKLDAPIVTNIVMVGALLGASQLPLERKDIENEMWDSFPRDRMELNLKALEMGINALSAQN
ncbi:MAG: indolepyruvate oxidoreductase subunit beta [Chloroflexota bacterium]|nr:indolepyruvate oxidoreductase subunit beta [Chloroflexota bacterium]